MHKFRRITRYRYNGVPMDNGGRYFYIKEGDTVWNPGWKPCKTPLDSYECRHGMNYTRITSSKNDVGARCTVSSFLSTLGLGHKMTLKDNSKEVKSLEGSFSSQNGVCGMQPLTWKISKRNFSTGEVEVEGYYNLPQDGISQNAEKSLCFLYYLNTDIQGYDTDRESFIGLYNEFADPEAVVEGKPRNSFWLIGSSPCCITLYRSYPATSGRKPQC